MATIVTVGAILFILANLIYFFKDQHFKYSYFSTALFLKLFFVLLSIMISFAVLYYALSFDNPMLRVSSPSGKPVEHTFLNYLYYSGVTILSVGYGDYIPTGHLRFFALLEAAIGLLLPTAYFMKVLDSKSNKGNE
ncbi:potassium channel family protein [Rossellomorea vietnamensis]|uniref:potassium channel family protein n=1 Tax=Rossellomorea vietnamensis TaxID=218284 RepID=UPI001CCB53C5|nr:potassium channel family protein [Rossellomorea vietnamensis]MCA0149274.1 potassium channel family protein [Rossellomorea vietnamensis]